MTRRTTPRGWWHAFRRAVSWHRRKLAVLAALAAVLTGLSALAPPAPEVVDVVRVRGSLPGGTRLSASDLRLDQLPPDALPRGAITDVAAAEGRVLVARTAADEILSDAAVAGPRSALAAGHVIAPLRLADAATARLLQEGTVVDILAANTQTGAAETVASDVRVVGLPPPAGDAGGLSTVGADDSGGDGGVGGGDGTVLVLVDVDRPTAQRLARAEITSRLSVVWR